MYRVGIRLGRWLEWIVRMGCGVDYVGECEDERRDDGFAVYVVECILLRLEFLLSHGHRCQIQYLLVLVSAHALHINTSLTAHPFSFLSLTSFFIEPKRV